MDIKDICEGIIRYILIFQITNNREKKDEIYLKLRFLKNFRGLWTPLEHFEYFWNYDIRD